MENTARLPLPMSFLEWQVSLLRWSMIEHHGAPHIGAAPLLLVERPGTGPGVSGHSIAIGLVPRAPRLIASTDRLRELYGARRDGDWSQARRNEIQYLHDYYRSAEHFQPRLLTTLLPADVSAVERLESAPRCSLVFRAFELKDRIEDGQMRCMQIECEAQIVRSGPLFKHVYWHHALFHGLADDHVAIAFRHLASYETALGSFDPMSD
jgi:hypothetical protein